MPLDPPAQGGEAPRRLHRVLVWSLLTLLAALALALAMVIASLALELGAQPPPPQPPPIHLSPRPANPCPMCSWPERGGQHATGPGRYRKGKDR